VRRLTLAAAAALAAPPAAAHEGHAHAIGWTLDPGVIVPLVVALGLYLAGLTRLRQRSTGGRSRLRRHAALYLLGWLLLAGALVSPLHEAGEVSFTFHMIEHELIMLPAALLLVAARPGPVLLWGLPRTLRSVLAPLIRLGLWRSLGTPFVATALQAAAIVGWHTPALFDRALTSDTWHIAQHLTFLFAALAFWWAMLARRGDGAGNMVSALCLFVTSMVGGGVGALMALDASPWYSAYAALGATPFGLSPAEDQQLAGVIMWVPGGLFHLAAAMVFLARALRSAPERLEPGVSRGRETA
jgi:cytochrome c oxidase assembly factor CtaG